MNAFDIALCAAICLLACPAQEQGQGDTMKIGLGLGLSRLPNGGVTEWLQVEKGTKLDGIMSKIGGYPGKRKIGGRPFTPPYFVVLRRGQERTTLMLVGGGMERRKMKDIPGGAFKDGDVLELNPILP